MRWNTIGKHVAAQSAATSLKEQTAVILYLSNGWLVEVLDGHGRHRA